MTFLPRDKDGNEMLPRWRPYATRQRDPSWKPWVTDLDSAIDAYWAALSPRENQAAYHEILLFGGPDGYPAGYGRFWRTRAALARLARIFALWVEGRHDQAQQPRPRSGGAGLHAGGDSCGNC